MRCIRKGSEFTPPLGLCTRNYSVRPIPDPGLSFIELALMESELNPDQVKLPGKV
jgi:hypothetical protein